MRHHFSDHWREGPGSHRLRAEPASGTHPRRRRAHREASGVLGWGRSRLLTAPWTSSFLWNVECGPSWPLTPTRLCPPTAEHLRPSLCPEHCSLSRERGPRHLEASKRLRRDSCTRALQPPFPPCPPPPLLFNVHRSAFSYSAPCLQVRSIAALGTPNEEDTVPAL